MAALEPYADFIRELFDSGKTHSEISTALQRYGAPQCSVMSVRRFCMEHNLRRRNHVSDTDLEVAVMSSVNRITLGYIHINMPFICPVTPSSHMRNSQRNVPSPTYVRNLFV